MPAPKHRVYDEEVLEFFRHTPTTDISDALTRLNLQAVRMWGILPLKRFSGTRHMAGPAVTIRFLPCHRKEQYQESDYRLTEIVEEAPAGSVVVIQGGDFMPVQGELNCLTAIRSGHEGSVGDGPIRDVDKLLEMPMPIFYKHAPIGVMMSSYVGRLYCAGAYEPIECGGALVRPGDLIVGDNSGVVVVPYEFVDTIAEYCREIAEHENQMRQKIRAGVSWKNIYGSEHKAKYFDRARTTEP